MGRSTLYKVGRWIEERSGIGAALTPMLTHVVPRDARWWYVFGSAALCAFTVQVLTGLALAMVYVPGGEAAYESLVFISRDASFGRLLRGMHSFGASAMVLLVVLHLTQVFLHAAYKYPRELNWISGVVLLAFTLAMGFTGQLLRWDANGVWSVVVATEMAGRVPLIGDVLAHFVLAGETINGGTLSRFFVMHAMVLPALILMAVGLHMWLIIHNGISEMPVPGQPVDPKTYRAAYEDRLAKTGVPFWPYAMWRDATASCAVVAVIVAAAWIFGPPELGAPPDPSDLHADPEPDWYFLWYFAVLSLIPPAIETWIIICLPIAGFGVLFAVPFLSNRGERAPSKRPWAVATVIVLWTCMAVLTIFGARAPWSPDFAARPLPAAVIGSTEPEVLRGADLFHRKGCMYCHDIGGHGGHRGPDLTTVAHRLTRDELILRINNGGHNMPSFAGVVARDDLAALLAFLETRH